MIAWLAAKALFCESQNNTPAKVAKARREFIKICTSLML
jgi:hypothetical protein